MSILPNNDVEATVNDEQREAQTVQTAGDGGDRAIVKAYLNGISHFSLLAVKEEIDLGRNISERNRQVEELVKAHADGLVDDDEYEYEQKKGCLYDDLNRLKERMINSHLRLVFSIAKRYQYRGLPLPDLINEGNIGLIKAINHYDYRCGCRFSTYCTWWIRQTLRKAIAVKSRPVRLRIDNINSFNRF